MGYARPVSMTIVVAVSSESADPLKPVLGCNAVAVACYGAAGATFGTVTAGVGIPAVVVGCNAALGTCMAACAVVALAPTL